MTDTRDELALADEHARYHDMPGNLYGADECGWERCEFFAVARHMLASGVLDNLRADAWDECCRQLQVTATNSATHEAGGRLRRDNPYRNQPGA